MSKKNLLEIMKAFSEPELENMVFAITREKFLSGDWGTAIALVEFIIHGPHDINFRAKMAAFGVFMAARARNITLALQCYSTLEQADLAGANIQWKAEALEELASLLLPDKPEMLADFWEKAIKIALPPALRAKLLKTGQNLKQQFLKNQDFENFARIKELLKNCLSSTLDFTG